MVCRGPFVLDTHCLQAQGYGSLSFALSAPVPCSTSLDVQCNPFPGSLLLPGARTLATFLALSLMLQLNSQMLSCERALPSPLHIKYLYSLESFSAEDCCHISSFIIVYYLFPTTRAGISIKRMWFRDRKFSHDGTDGSAHILALGVSTRGSQGKEWVLQIAKIKISFSFRKHKETVNFMTSATVEILL